MNVRTRAGRSAIPYIVAMSLMASACATGNGSFVTGNNGGNASDIAGNDIGADNSDFNFDQAAPGLVAASGNALLPGSRSPAAAALLGQTGPVGAASATLSEGSPLANGAVSATANLLGANGPALDVTASLGAPPLGSGSGSVSAGLLGQNGPTVGAVTALGVNSPVVGAAASTSAALTGPLLALNGRTTGVLGASGGVNLLGTGASVGSALNVGGGTSPQTATTQTIISVNSAMVPVAPSGAGTTTPPMMPPAVHMASGVPGTVPLTTIIKQLPVPLLGH